MIRVLVMTPQPEAARVIGEALPDGRIETAAALDVAEQLGRRTPFEYAFVDAATLRALAEGGKRTDPLSAFREAVPGARVVVMSAPDATREAVGFVADGASDFLSYPLVREQVAVVREAIERRERLRSELRYLRDRSLDSDVLGAVSSRADSMKAVLRKIRQVAPTRSTVLLTGETGTGKSFLAKVIHQNSTRSQRQFVSLHCGAIPDTLLESELFGHERGAFTGADRRKLGKFEIAHGGTLFLDEIATITPAMQVKLLDVLQERTIQRVGGERDIEVDVRILAATNMDLEALTHQGAFRTDLFYRLNVFPIEIPPLRERREDIPLLVGGFLERLCRYHQKAIREVDPAVMTALVAYDWPGNVRELENLLERAVIIESAPVLTATGFPRELTAPPVTARPECFTPTETLAEARARIVAVLEREYLERQLDAHHGRIDATAAAAGVTPRQLHKLMTRYGLKKESFKR